MNNAVKDIKPDLKEETTDQPEAQKSKESDEGWIFAAIIILMVVALGVVSSCRAIVDERIEAINQGFAMRDEALNLALSNFCPNHANEISRALGVKPLPVRPDVVESAH